MEQRESDRVPIDIGGGSSTSIVVEGYKRLKRYLGFNEKKVHDRLFRVAEVDEEVASCLGVDVRPVTVKAPKRSLPHLEKREVTIDEWGVKWKPENILLMANKAKKAGRYPLIF
ncbi:hypothetical protein ES702_05346 [subsurface metagenome]|uniref:Uncharacterized protein n=1 Tax=Aerophobetes bacterium TaxID=2030807 RepID=A0A523RNQ1_UNCAE|nr:MAG: hypothetical protein E3J84_07580 [Candidatus Aerophobetes bacterium]